jgi:anti-sigma-K factor RskA
MTDDELRDLLALAAVGALTADEQREVDAALETRPDLLAELDGLREVATTMADAVAESPPPGLRARVLDVIAATPQEATAPGAAPSAAEAPLAPVVPITAARRRRWLAVGAAAAAVVALVAGVLIVSPFDDDGPTDQVAAVVDADDAVEIPMPETGEPGSLPGLTIVYSADEGAAVLLADEVPLPEGDNVYELWAIRDGTPESFATFRPADDGQLSVYAAGLDPASAEVWAITEEQAGGSPTGQPTTAILNATA